MKASQRRELILQFFIENPSLHPLAEDVYNYAKKFDSSIGIATIYRHLKKLVEEQYIRELNLEKQGVRYDYIEKEHSHFVCDSCQKIMNFTLNSLEDIKTSVEQKTNGIITNQNIIFHGKCQECLHKEKSQ